MVDYGLKDRVAIITGANNPWGIGATTALAFAREGAKVVLVYKKVSRPFDATKMDKNGVDRYYGANAGDAAAVESKLQEIGADYLVLESDISNEDAVKEIYSAVFEKYERVPLIMKTTFYLTLATSVLLSFSVLVFPDFVFGAFTSEIVASEV